MSILQDKIALVTGAGAGIGRATALAMADVGAKVAAADIDLAAAQRTADQAAGNARRAIAIEPNRCAKKRRRGHRAACGVSVAPVGETRRECAGC